MFDSTTDDVAGEAPQASTAAAAPQILRLDAPAELPLGASFALSLQSDIALPLNLKALIVAAPQAKTYRQVMIVDKPTRVLDPFIVRGRLAETGLPLGQRLVYKLALQNAEGLVGTYRSWSFVVVAAAVPDGDGEAQENDLTDDDTGVAADGDSEPEGEGEDSILCRSCSANAPCPTGYSCDSVGGVGVCVQDCLQILRIPAKPVGLCPDGFSCTVTPSNPRCLPNTLSYSCSANTLYGIDSCARERLIAECRDGQVCDAVRGSCQDPPVDGDSDGTDTRCRVGSTCCNADGFWQAQGTLCREGGKEVCLESVCSAEHACVERVRAGFCYIANLGCMESGQSSPVNSCLACDGKAPHTLTALAEGAVCDDGNACTTNDTCQKEVCVPGAALVCIEDRNPCTKAVCDPFLGCQQQPQSDIACPSPGPCAVTGVCKEGTCAVGRIAADCTPCTNSPASSEDACLRGACVSRRTGEPFRCPGACPQTTTDKITRLKVPQTSVCIDAYEASLIADKGTQSVVLGSVEADYGSCPAADGTSGSCTYSLSVQAQEGIRASRYLNWPRAAELCRLAGARLCSVREWQTACGGPAALAYPYGTAYKAAVCVDSSYFTGTNPLPQIKGLAASCETGGGAFDMVGNVEEWLEDSDGFSDGHYIAGGSCNTQNASCKTLIRDYGSNGAAQRGVRCCQDVPEGTDAAGAR